MKYATRILAMIALCSAAAIPSCVLKKEDAITLGQKLASDALAVSMKKLSGQPVNLKLEAFTLGADLATSALELASANTGIAVDAKALVNYAVEHAGVKVQAADTSQGDPTIAAQVVEAAADQAEKIVEARAPPNL